MAYLQIPRKLTSLLQRGQHGGLLHFPQYYLQQFTAAIAVVVMLLACIFWNGLLVLHFLGDSCMFFSIVVLAGFND